MLLWYPALNCFDNLLGRKGPEILAFDVIALQKLSTAELKPAVDQRFIASEDSQQDLFVIPEHIAVVVQATSLVHDMHQAYEAISHGPGFALFLSGPSKTADIEQALVIGAHGARSCTVLLAEA